MCPRKISLAFTAGNTCYCQRIVPRYDGYGALSSECFVTKTLNNAGCFDNALKKTDNILFRIRLG